MISFILWTVVIGAAVNLLCAIILYCSIRWTNRKPLDESLQESATIVMPVRGCDPKMEKTIAALLTQSFRDYQLLVVVDNQADPAWAQLQEMKGRLDVDQRMKIVPLEQHRSTCSLKCSALIQAVEMLENDMRWVAFVDADVVVHQNWLADILGPLVDLKVVVVSGNQWFEPPAPWATGSLLRSIWNAGAIVPTLLLKHPWAGSMAMRYEDLVVGSLIDDWRTSIVDDGPVAKFAKQLDGKIVIHSNLLMVNREACSKTFAMNWIARMLTWSRIFEPTFPITVLHATLSVFLAIAIDLCIIWSVLSLDGSLIVSSVGALLVATTLSVMGFAVVRSAVSISQKKRGLKPLTPMGVDAFKSIAVMLGPVLVLYWWGCIRAINVKRISWRGVEYEIEGKSVELVEYSPWSRALASDSDSI